VPLVLIVLLAAALRFPTLGAQSIWFDEAATWDLVRRPLGEMLGRIPDGESTPPLFYLLEWLSVRVLGDGEAGLRALSALAGVLTVLVAYGIGRRLAGSRAGLATAALVAVNPLLVWFSQEARAYALVALLSAASLLLLLRCLDDARRGSLAAWAIVAILALATHYFAAFVLAPQALWLLWRHSRRAEANAAVGALVLAGAALLPLLLAQRGNPYDIAGESVGIRLLQLPKQFLLGYRGPLAVPLGLLGAALVLGGAWLLLRHVDWRTRERALGVATIGALGVLIPVLAALVGTDYLNARNALPALVPLLAALGVAYGASQARAAGAALLAGLCALSIAVVIAVAADREYQRPDWAGLADALGETGEPRALVVTPANGVLALRYYRPGLETMDAGGAGVSAVEVVTVAAADAPGAAPELAPLVGTSLGVAGFAPATRIDTPTYAILRFASADGRPVTVTPDPLGALRFGERPPAVATVAVDR
jgi:4-amino-4-deoxy-L-arabinose transferase-like glycosyltransferase